MKDAAGKRQQSSFKSFLNKPYNPTVSLNISNHIFSDIVIEFNNHFKWSDSLKSECINYVKNNYKLIKIPQKIYNVYLVKRTLYNGYNFLIKFYAK